MHKGPTTDNGCCRGTGPEGEVDCAPLHRFGERQTQCRSDERATTAQLSTSLLHIFERDLLGPADPSPPLLFAPRETCTAMTTPGTDVSRNANSSIVVLHVVGRERSHDNAVCLSSARAATDCPLPAYSTSDADRVLLLKVHVGEASAACPHDCCIAGQ